MKIVATETQTFIRVRHTIDDANRICDIRGRKNRGIRRSDGNNRRAFGKFNDLNKP